MISEFFFPNHPGLTLEQRGMLKGVSDEFQAFELKKQLGQAMLDKFDGTTRSKQFDTQAKRLDILMKKKQLGLPLYDGDYEDLLNDSDAKDLTSAAGNLTITYTHPVVSKGTVPKDFIPFFETPARPEGGWERHFGTELTGLDAMVGQGGVKIKKSVAVADSKGVFSLIKKLFKA